MKNRITGNTALIIGIFLTIIAPSLLTHIFLTDWLVLDKEEFANIGATIGGITAPIVGLVGAWLIYLTLQEQKKANHDNILLNSLLQLDNLISQSGLFEYNQIIESKLIVDFNEFNGEGIPDFNFEPIVKEFANKHFFSLMNVAIQIHILTTQMNISDNDIIKSRILAIINNIKNTHTYNAILQTGIFILEDGKNKTPIRLIEDSEDILSKWNISFPN